MLTENHLEMGNMKAKIVITYKALFPLNFKKREGEDVVSGCTLVFVIVCVVERKKMPGSEPQV